MKVKKIKFTHVAEKRKSSKIKLFNKINTISVKSGHDRTEYWDPGEINEPENSKDTLNFLHLNISSLPYHFLNYGHYYHLLKLILISLESLNQESNKTK